MFCLNFISRNFYMRPKLFSPLIHALMPPNENVRIFVCTYSDLQWSIIYMQQKQLYNAIYIVYFFSHFLVCNILFIQFLKIDLPDFLSKATAFKLFFFFIIPWELNPCCGKMHFGHWFCAHFVRSWAQLSLSVWFLINPADWGQSDESCHCASIWD